MNRLGFVVATALPAFQTATVLGWHGASLLIADFERGLKPCSDPKKHHGPPLRDGSHESLRNGNILGFSPHRENRYHIAQD
jgi:hypothetical protein